MIHFNYKHSRISAIWLFVVAILSIGLSATVYAWPILGRDSGCGYFYGNCVPSVGNADVIDGGIPSSIKTVGALIIFLKEKNDIHSSIQNKVGSAFIVNTMLGRSAPGKGIDVSADWVELETILTALDKKGGIKWNVSRQVCTVNSYYQSTKKDDAFFTRTENCKNEPSIEFYDGASLIYTIDRKCGNPMGEPLPPPHVELSDCRPIVKDVVLRTHPAVAASANNPIGYPVIPATTVPVNVSTSKQNWGPFSNNTTIEATALHTTGDIYTVTFTETKKYISSYTDNFNKQGPEIFDNSGRSFSPKRYSRGPEIFDNIGRSFNPKRYSQGPEIKDNKGRSYNPKRYSQGPEILNYSYNPKRYSQGPEILDYSARSYSPKRYTMLYSGTTINYSGPDSWTSTIGPCYDYTLTADIGTNFTNNRVEPGASVTITPLVSVTKYDTYITHSMNSEWQITKMVVQPNIQLSAVSGGNSNSDPCDYFADNLVNAGKVANCLIQASNNSTIFSVFGSSVNTSSTYTAPDIPAGTKICFAFSVRARAGWDRDSKDNKWSHGTFDPVNNCITMIKGPKVQVWGGDLSVGGVWSGSPSASKLVKTRNSLKSNQTFGSWVEYGILATGSITGMASGSAFAGGLTGVTTTSSCSYSTLSFTNAGCGAVNVGYYTTLRTIPDVAASFSETGVPISGTVSPHNLTSGTYTAGDLILKTSELEQGQSIIIKASGTVTIIGNQTYDSNNNGANYTKISQLPQLVIIADKIIISDGVANVNNIVTNVDAWLIANGAKGIIETCDTGSSTYLLSGNNRLTVNKCKDPLIVNGPVMAKQLWLRRTAGSGTGLNSGEPAEIFNLRADAYLWAALRASDGTHIQTVFTTELPPRF